MIKLERTSVMNLENAMRGARNPMNSWGRMDSFYDENGEYKDFAKQEVTIVNLSARFSFP